MAAALRKKSPESKRALLVAALLSTSALAACGGGSNPGGTGGYINGSGGSAAGSGGASGSGGSGTGSGGRSTGTGGAGTGGAGAGGGSGGRSAGSGGAGGTVLGLTARPPNTTCKPPAVVDQPAAKLSQTGCVDPNDPTRPAAGLIPYTVSSPLWSDGADKERFMALPDGMTITVKDCAREPATCAPVASGGTMLDEWDMEVPGGTVLVKTFSFGAKRIETRLLVRFDRDNWFGYSYEWNDAGTDADVLPDNVEGKDKMITGLGGQPQTWHFPARTECLRCHTESAGVSLGLEVGQLNGDFRYPASGRTSNQLATLAAIGVFSAPLPASASAMQPLPLPTDTRFTLDQRARSYLHANCAICHRPGGNFDSIDLRFATALGARNICNVAQEKGDLGVAGSRRLVPGMPSSSVMWLRMDTLDSRDRMPQIGSLVRDVSGTNLIRDWIAGLTSCQ
jgi:uncharacterized repeat protein (TIGR03806 family)